jgi:hypothetical protein
LTLDRLTVLFVAALALPFLVPPYVPFEPAWEISSGLGYVACAAAAFCCCLGWRRRAGARPLGVPRELELHRLAGHALWLATLGHVAIMLLFDPAVLEYLRWTMPWGVVAGLVAVPALAATVLTREPRRRPVIRARGLPAAHASFALMFGGLAILHIVPDQSKLMGPWQPWLVPAVLVLAAGPSLRDLLERRFGRRLPGGTPRAASVRIEWLTRSGRVSLGLLLALVFLCTTVAAQLMARP